MEDKRASAPGMLKKSTANAYTLEEKVRNMEKEIEAYKERMNKMETYVTELFEDDGYDTEEYEPSVGGGTFTISWMPNEEPRVTQRDLEMRIWRMNNPTEPTIPEQDFADSLLCDEQINDL